MIRNYGKPCKQEHMVMDHILVTRIAEFSRPNNKTTVNITVTPLSKRNFIFSASMEITKHKWSWAHWQTIALRKCRFSFATALCLSLLVAPVLSVSEQTDAIKPFEANYTVGNNFVTAASAKLSLSGSDENWIYSLTIAPSGIFKLSGKGRIEELSTLKYTDNEFQSQSYNHRQLGDKKRDVGAIFDWQNNQLTFQYRDKDDVIELSDPVYDRFSITLTVRERLRSGFDQLTFQVFDRGRIKSVVFENTGLETLSTKLGELDAYKVRSYNDDGTRKRTTTTWYAPTLDYLPVKIEQHKQGDLIARLSITSLTR